MKRPNLMLLMPLLVLLGAVVFPASASVETLDLVCSYDTASYPGNNLGADTPYSGADVHISVDLVKSTANHGSGPKAAGISATVIEWQWAEGSVQGKYSIDRTTGKIIYQQLRDGKLEGSFVGKCRRAEAKF